MNERELFQKLLSHCLLICKSGCNHINLSGLASEKREERCATCFFFLFFFTVSNTRCGCSPTAHSVCVCACACLTNRTDLLCLISNESGISCHYVCPCASRRHTLFRIILPCANHADKVKLDISMGFSCVCSRVVAVRVCVWVHARA